MTRGGVAGAQDGLALAYAGLAVAGDCLAVPGQGLPAGQVGPAPGTSATASRPATGRNTSAVCSPPSRAVVCTVYSMTRTVTGGPSLFRGGLSSAGTCRPPRTCTGLRVDGGGARRRRCEPVAGIARAAAQDRERAVREHQQARAEASPAGPWPAGCSAPVYGPIAAPSRLPVLEGARRDANRARGNAPVPGLAGGPAEERDELVASGTSVTDPRQGDHPQPAAEHPRRPGTPPAGPATCPDNVRGGPEPSDAAPDQDREEMSGSHHWRPPPASTRPSGASRPARRVRRPAAGNAARRPASVHQLPVTAVPAPDQRQRQHEVQHGQPGRQHPAPLLPASRSHR